ncbi:MAG: hypothetical protein ABW166_02305 [Sedimenticola sp.]
MEKHYEIIFTGIKNTPHKEEIKYRVSQLLHIKYRASERLINSTDRVVLTHKVNLDQAVKLRRLLDTAGVNCEIRPCNASVSATAAVVENSCFTCPSCGFTEKLTNSDLPPEVCPSCKIITAEYSASKDEARERESIQENLRSIRKRELAIERAALAAVKADLPSPLSIRRQWQVRAVAVGAVGIAIALVTALFLPEEPHSVVGDESIPQTITPKDTSDESQYAQGDYPNNLPSTAAGHGDVNSSERE